MFNKSKKLIAIDWGTSNRTAFLFDFSGSVIDTKSDSLGLNNIIGNDFHNAYLNLISNWQDVINEVPTLISGMAGASTGWIEAPYCELPAGIESLVKNLKKVPFKKNIWIIPGLKLYNYNNVPDVIRGEETQAIGVSERFNNTLIITPGTHSKWIKIRNQKIVWFSTFMTGDLHKAILNHTIISALNKPREKIHYEPFLNGVNDGLAQKNNFSHLLFGARTKVLFGKLKQRDVSDYLSGLLIGAEVSSGLAAFRKKPAAAVLIGNKALCNQYAKALKICKIKTTFVKMTTAARAYMEIAKCAGLIKD